MTPADRIKAHRLQLDGLASWPAGPERELMREWVLRQIAKWTKELKT